MISNTVLNWIYENHSHRLTSWNNLPVLSPANLQLYAQAISRKGSPLKNCFGFVDGTVRQISRPGDNQRVVYIMVTNVCTPFSFRQLLSSVV